VKTVTSPSSAPQVTFRQATRGVSNENEKKEKKNGGGEGGDGRREGGGG